MGRIMVSINCLAYNHEKYIARALDSIIMQKVEFEYEILVHDDASTDKTAEIIQKYEENYPNLLNVIYEVENTYSKGAKILDNNISRAKGKYIAICEGDDYWTDPYKLQKQFDFLENNPGYSLCVHASYLSNRCEKILRKTIRPHIGDKEFTIEEIIKTGGRLFATNSMMYRSELGRPLPEFYMISLVEDHPLMILLAFRGKVFYMDEFMSAYCIGIEYSWTNRTYSDTTMTLKHYDHSIKMLDKFNQFSDFNFDETVQGKKKSVIFNSLLAKKDYHALKSVDYRELYNDLSCFRKLLIYLSKNHPHLYSSLQGEKKKWKNKHL